LRPPCGASSAFGVRLFHRVGSERAQGRDYTPRFGEWGTVGEKTSAVASGDGAYLVFSLSSPLARQVRESRSQDTVHKWFEGTVVEPNRPLTSRVESVLDQKCSAGGDGYHTDVWLPRRRRTSPRTCSRCEARGDRPSKGGSKFANKGARSLTLVALVLS